MDGGKKGRRHVRAAPRSPSTAAAGITGGGRARSCSRPLSAVITDSSGVLAPVSALTWKSPPSPRLHYQARR